jgi:hypothetical protein
VRLPHLSELPILLSSVCVCSERDSSGTTPQREAQGVMERIARREPQKKQQHFLKSAAVFFVREAARPISN